MEMVEEAGPGAIQDAVTDGFTEIIGVSCKLVTTPVRWCKCRP